MPRMRGARPSPRNRLAAATPHRLGLLPPPPNFFWKPFQLSMWLNDLDGDCVTAEEAFKCACSPGVFITDDTVLAWATSNNVLNGTELTTVLDIMQFHGFPQDGVVYNDGPFTAVDWTSAVVLQDALTQGPVKIGVAAAQLEAAVPEPPVSGWFATGFNADPNMDHCVSLCGFGEIGWLAQEIATQLNVQVNIPSNVDGAADAYALYTWKSIGIIDVPSLLAICGEAWLRNPSTVVETPSVIGAHLPPLK